MIGDDDDDDDGGGGDNASSHRTVSLWTLPPMMLSS